MIQYLASNLNATSIEVEVPKTGVASYTEMVEFVQDVFNTRTYVPDDITSAELAHAVVQSILNRLRVGF